MTTSPNGRLNFSKNPSTIPLPNMIQVQRTSYEDFLQMDLLPDERGAAGLQSVLSTIFPFTDFRETCELQFVRYEIGNWSCRCGILEGLEHLRLTCEHCGERFKAGDPHEDRGRLSLTAARRTRTGSRSATSAGPRWASVSRSRPRSAASAG